MPGVLLDIRHARSSLTRALLEDVERAARLGAELLDHVGVDHGCLDARVPEVFLNLPDVHSWSKSRSLILSSQHSVTRSPPP